MKFRPPSARAFALCRRTIRRHVQTRACTHHTRSALRVSPRMSRRKHKGAAPRGHRHSPSVLQNAGSRTALAWAATADSFAGSLPNVFLERAGAHLECLGGDQRTPPRRRRNLLACAATPWRGSTTMQLRHAATQPRGGSSAAGCGRALHRPFLHRRAALACVRPTHLSTGRPAKQAGEAIAAARNHRAVRAMWWRQAENARATLQGQIRSCAS